MRNWKKPDSIIQPVMISPSLNKSLTNSSICLTVNPCCFELSYLLIFGNVAYDCLTSFPPQTSRIYFPLSWVFWLPGVQLIFTGLSWAPGSRLDPGLLYIALFSLTSSSSRHILIMENGRSTRGQANHLCTFEASAWSCLLSFYWPKKNHMAKPNSGGRGTSSSSSGRVL